MDLGKISVRQLPVSQSHRTTPNRKGPTMLVTRAVGHSVPEDHSQAVLESASVSEDRGQVESPVPPGNQGNR